jgi:hypothetical protein
VVGVGKEDRELPMGVSSQSRENKNSKEVETYTVERLNSLREYSLDYLLMLAELSALDEVPQMQARGPNARNLFLRLETPSYCS